MRPQSAGRSGTRGSQTFLAPFIWTTRQDTAVGYEELSLRLRASNSPRWEAGRPIVTKERGCAVTTDALLAVAVPSRSSPRTRLRGRKGTDVERSETTNERGGAIVAKVSEDTGPPISGRCWVYSEHRCRGSLTTSTLRCSPLSKMGSESQLQPISVLVTSVKVTPDLSSETHTWFRVFPIGGARGETPPDGERPAAKLAEHHAQN